MKKLVLTFGGISAFIILLIGSLTMSIWMDSENYALGELIGYSTMILAFSSIFIAVKKYREEELNGSIKFITAFLIGLYITIVASLIYTASWSIYAANSDSMSEFAQKYNDKAVEEIQNSDISDIEKKEKIEETKEFMEMYKNPVIRTAVTFLEIFPVGFIISIIVAFFMKTGSNVFLRTES
jgi:hypothetical protein